MAAAARAFCRIAWMNVWVFVEMMYINLIKIFSNTGKMDANVNFAFRKNGAQYIAFFLNASAHYRAERQDFAKFGQNYCDKMKRMLY
ncbi:MAG: hypothetical protein PUC97_05545 [bacterium]|nr:hypothetical protein [bacterium]